MDKQEIGNKMQALELREAAKVGELATALRNGSMNQEDADKALKEERSAIAAEKLSLEQQLAMLNKPTEKEERSFKITNADFIKAAEEHRSITIGKNGAINQVKELVQAVGEQDGILGSVTTWYGKNAATNIPVLDPTVADPGAQSEGATSISADSTAVFGTCEIQPKAFVSVLPISAEALAMGSINLESELPGIFGKAFRKVMHNKIVTGSDSGKGFNGLFAAVPSANVTELGPLETAPKLKELANFALSVADADEEYTIIMNSKVYTDCLADSTSGEDVKLWKESLIRNKEIEGVKVVLDRHAPTTTSAGSKLVVAAPLARYGLGIAGEIIIDPIKVKGDTNTYFQATMFLGGQPYSAKDLKALAVATPST